ncbi:MEKHLA domain-containing protein [Pseudomonas sp. NPDC085632]|jgi:hypothetical protein|uniref:MEKHLA domain-containing protein n=1 Tax=Pseudomonas sp. NPDC085632 TaxID=3364429 RepID=UPI0037CC0249
MKRTQERHQTPDTLIRQLDESYRHWTGEGLPCPVPHPGSREEWIHHQAPYSVLSHNDLDDPCFVYANECALACFKYSREIFYAMPSRFSASSLDRLARQALLEVVSDKGIASGYCGYRVDRQGAAFMIHDGIVWEVLNEAGIRIGQAALFWPEAAPVDRFEPQENSAAVA